MPRAASDRMLSSIAIAAAGVTVVMMSVVSSAPVQAAQTNKSVDCSAGALTEATAQAVFGDLLVVDADVDDLLVIENSSTTQTCVVADPSGIITNEGTVSTSGSRSLTLTKSGSITLAGNGGTDPAVTITIDLCSLAAGSGTESDPWQVANQADFRQVGEQSTSTGGSWCSRSGNYLQTASFTLDDAAADARVYMEDDFSGVYDGDHYTITLAGTSGGWADPTAGAKGLFGSLTGTVKKVRLSGSLFTNNADTAVGSLVSVMSGGTVSESSSTVNIRIVGDRTSVTAATGGLVGEASSGAIVYSRYVGTLEWAYDQEATQAPRMGGLLGLATTGLVTVADSYARPTFTWDNGALFPNSGNFYGAGLVGDLDDGSDEGTDLYLLRSYATPTAVITGTPDSGQSPFLGGIINPRQGEALSQSVFFLESTEFPYYVGGTSTPFDYAASLPVLPGLNRTYLTDITTYQSREDAEETGVPSGLADMDATANHRWAIEQGNVTTFVPSDYATPGNYSTRQGYSTPVATATYQTRGVERSVTSYPILGRVWEICANENDGYPVLVWEERTCAGPGGGSSRSDEEDVAAQAAALGLTEAEYAEFLASGLTLEQFLAARLAATGVSLEAILLGGMASLILLSVGGWLLAVQRSSRIRG